MTDAVSGLGALIRRAAGRFAGQGVWRDDAGDSHRYDIEMSLAGTPGKGLELAYRHVFFEEADTPDVDVSFVLTETAPSILTFKLPGLPVEGRGYSVSDLLHFTIPVPGNTIEVTMFFGDATVRVAGSSERNSAGRYIMWDETLKQV